MFWSGFFAINIITIYPVPITFLIINRCCSIKFFTKMKTKGHYLTYFSVFVISFVVISNVTVSMLELPLNIEKGNRFYHNNIF